VPGVPAFVGFLLLTVWLFSLLRQLKAERKGGILFAMFLALATFASGSAAFLVLAAAVVLSVLWLAALVRERKLRLRTLVALGALGAFVALVFLAVAIPSGLLRSGAPMAQSGRAVHYEESAPAPMAAAKSARLDETPASPAAGAPSSGSAGTAYEGLPAKVQLPGGARSTWWSREMLAADAAPRVRVLLAGPTLVTLVQALVVLATLGLFWRSRERLREGLAALRARVQAPSVPASPPPVPLPTGGDGTLC
jgi:amino acid transporter